MRSPTAPCARSTCNYYIFFADDAAGRLLAHLLAAADAKPCASRLLLTASTWTNRTPLLDALGLASSEHPGAPVQSVPRAQPTSIWSKALQFTVDGARLNRRMHNKSFTVDNIYTIVGVQHQRRVLRRELAGLFPRSRRARDRSGHRGRPRTHVFDRYWNSGRSLPGDGLRPAPATGRNLSRTRDAARRGTRVRQSDYAQAMLDALPDGSSADRNGRWDWGVARVVADDPGQTEPVAEDALPPTHDLRAMLDAASADVEIVAITSCRGRPGVGICGRWRRARVRISVLTNSLAATDETAVHAGYAPPNLLAAGVRLYELRPLTARPDQAHGTSSGVSLHAKTARRRRARSVRRLDEHGPALAPAPARKWASSSTRRRWHGGSCSSSTARRGGKCVQGRTGAESPAAAGACADTLDQRATTAAPWVRSRPEPPRDDARA